MEPYNPFNRALIAATIRMHWYDNDRFKWRRLRRAGTLDLESEAKASEVIQYAQALAPEPGYRDQALSEALRELVYLPVPVGAPRGPEDRPSEQPIPSR